MLNLSLKERKLIAKSEGIKGYKSMPEDRLLSALDASESVKGNESMPDPTITNITVRVRKENRDEDKVNKEGNAIKDKLLRDMRALFESNDNDYYELVKTSNSFNSNYIEYESNGDKNKSLSIKEYLNKVRSYLSDMIYNLEAQGE